MNEDDFAQLAALRNQQHHDYYERMNGTNVGKSVGELTSRIEALEAALQWYADKANYTPIDDFAYTWHEIIIGENVCEIANDGGERARKTLDGTP